MREQRSDLEDWVDELSLHAVLSPSASDETTLDFSIDYGLAHRNGQADVHDFEAPPGSELDDATLAELSREPRWIRRARRDGDSETTEFDPAHPERRR